MVRIALGGRGSVEGSPGDRLLDLCDADSVPALFSCRAGNCGVCAVRVLEGAELLDPATPDELSTLARFANGGDRLACQVRIGLQQSGTVRLVLVAGQ